MLDPTLCKSAAFCKASVLLDIQLPHQCPWETTIMEGLALLTVRMSSCASDCQRLEEGTASQQCLSCRLCECTFPSSPHPLVEFPQVSGEGTPSHHDPGSNECGQWGMENIQVWVRRTFYSFCLSNQQALPALGFLCMVTQLLYSLTNLCPNSLQTIYQQLV